jgi:hypothetical protein
MVELSILIPARNEMFLSRTIDNVIENIRGDTEVIAVCDGEWADPPIKDHPRVTVIYYPVSVGQRAATNGAAKVSKAKYLMKLDAHCSVDEGFDVKMISEMQDNWTMAPLMKNLHAFDWVCKKCGDKRYQGPTPIGCNNEKCDNKKDFERDIIWHAKNNPQSTSYCFDSEPHFQYFQEFKKRPEYTGKNLTETMSLQGSCFMVTRDKFFELDLCGEEFGSWGSQGIEVAVKTWLSGGKVVCNHKTWYGHMFRTQGGDFGFPWPASGRAAQKAKFYAKELFFNNKWDKQILPLSWLLDKFWPVPGWTETERQGIRKAGELFYAERKGVKMEQTIIGDDKTFKKDEPILIGKQMLQLASTPSTKEPTVGIVYYTDNRLDESIMKTVQKQIVKCCNGFDIVSVSLQPIDFGRNITLPQLTRSYLTMFKQQLAGIEESNADIIFMAEHDVLYHPSHFDFRPPRKDLFYYDENRWHVDDKTGHALFYHAMSVSMMCAYRELLLEHYRARVERVEREGYSFRIGFEPGGHKFPRGIDNYGREPYWASLPSIDIRHKQNLTVSRWSKEEFRNKRNLYAWTEAEEVPGWGRTKGEFQSILDKI